MLLARFLKYRDFHDTWNLLFFWNQNMFDAVVLETVVGDCFGGDRAI